MKFEGNAGNWSDTFDNYKILKKSLHIIYQKSIWYNDAFLICICLFVS